jgi:hypothetical protein
MHLSAFASGASGSLAHDLRSDTARRTAAREEMSHGPMGAEDHIIVAERCAHAHCHRLLSLILMQRAGDCSLQEKVV